MNDIPEEILALCRQVTAKRPKVVLDHIIAHGFVTTEELTELYGYNHPPRAAQDVKDCGIPLIRISVKSKSGERTIAAYKFGDPKDIVEGQLEGRKPFSKAFKKLLVEKFDSRSTLTREKHNPRYLQIDHRIPYAVAGNAADYTNPDEFMLLDASSQRAKSWSCEHCRNFQELRDPSICSSCFWAYPEGYTHIAMSPERRLYLVWQGAEIDQYKRLENNALEKGLTIQEYIKTILDQLS